MSKDGSIYEKFTVTRTDGTDGPGLKHQGCRYFVLDIDHDPYAEAALRAYAAICERTHPILSESILLELPHAG